MKTNRRVDPAQQKAKKQKVIVAVGAVILLALIGFELPKVMSHGKSPSTAAPPAATTTAGSAEAPATGAEPAAAAADPSLAAAPVAPAKLSSQSGATATDGQLITFTFMKSKDPFRQQLTEAETTTTGSTTPPASAPPASSPPTSTSPSYTPPASAPPSSTPPSSTNEPGSTTTTPEPTATTPEPTTTTPTSTEPSPAPPPSTAPSTPPAVTETSPTSTTTTPTGTTPEPTPAKPPVATVASLSVNGVVEKVKVDGTFPAAQPLFTLVSLKDGVARIGIAGGTLEGSTQTVALPVGKSVTLMNTADGMRYVVKLVAVS